MVIINLLKWKTKLNTLFTIIIFNHYFCCIYNYVIFINVFFIKLKNYTNKFFFIKILTSHKATNLLFFFKVYYNC